LASEKLSWHKKETDCRSNNDTVLADALYCACAITYFGIFPTNYRTAASAHIRELLVKHGITCPKNFSLQEKLSDPITIGKWTNTMRLPNDQFSIDNAIIMYSA
jgi:hypothetical protein